MTWLHSLDVGLFRFINLTLSNRVFDAVMPFLSGNSWFVPLLMVLAALLIWKEGLRGRVCLAMLALVICLGDPLVVNTLKHAVARPRPFNEITDAVTRVGRGGSFSMPSAHTANWFAAAVVLMAYYRRSAAFMLPLAGLVGFSRIYNGVHYPSDVLAGGILGAAYAGALLWGLDRAWAWAGSRWFPLWRARLPSLRELKPRPATGRARGDAGPRTPDPGPQTPDPGPETDDHWLRLGYVLIGVLLMARLCYLASGRIELSEDEAYQWLWSKHLALSYYSKPPLIACAQFLGTSIWGDREFGVRFFAPVIAAGLSLMLLGFLARETGARAGVVLVLAAAATPLLAAGSILMTVDPLAVLFWVAAMVSGWRSVQTGSTRHWLWTGLWMGLGFLSKYTSPLQWLCWAVFFGLWKPARAQWRRPGPWLALLVNVLCTLPVVIWNARHGWITMTHLEERGGLDNGWQPTTKYLRDFVLAEAGLLNPVFLAAAVWAAVAFWRRPRENPLLIYLFSMGAPVVVFYLCLSLRSRVLPNWIAVGVAPLFCLAAIYWEARWRAGVRVIRTVFLCGFWAGLAAVILLHDTDLVRRVSGRSLPARIDPMKRVRGNREMAALVGRARARLEAEGKPVFIIGNHYGVTSLISFYLPEARAGVPDRPLVYYRSSGKPENQFFFWPGYQGRKGQNAIFVQEVRAPEPPPDRIRNEFASVRDLGVEEVRYRDRVFHQIQLFECRDLR